MNHRLGIDLGGTTAKIALVKGRGVILKEATVPTGGFSQAARMTEEIANACRNLVKGQSIRRVGVGVAGDIDSTRGVVRVSPNLGWKNVPLKHLFEKQLPGSTVTVENDAKAAAWGLYKTQIPASIQHMIVMTLGTGVGGGLILGGKLHRGATGSAGEVGHMTIDENGPLCNCGNRGCLETYVGGPHIVTKVQRALEGGKKSRLAKLYREDPDQITPHAIAAAANAGDAYALSVWNEAGHALGLALGSLIYVLNPQLVCFTGGVSQAGDLILTPLWKTLRRRTFKTPIGAVKIRIADKAPNIGVIGASLL